MMASWIMQRLQRPNLARMEWDASLQKRQLMMDQVISQDCQQTTNKKTRRKGGRIRYPIPFRDVGISTDSWGECGVKVAVRAT